MCRHVLPVDEALRQQHVRQMLRDRGDAAGGRGAPIDPLGSILDRAL